MLLMTSDNDVDAAAASFFAAQDADILTSRHPPNTPPILIPIPIHTATIAVTPTAIPTVTVTASGALATSASRESNTRVERRQSPSSTSRQSSIINLDSDEDDDGNTNKNNTVATTVESAADPSTNDSTRSYNNDDIIVAPSPSPSSSLLPNTTTYSKNESADLSISTTPPSLSSPSVGCTNEVNTSLSLSTSSTTIAATPVNTNEQPHNNDDPDIDKAHQTDITSTNNHISDTHNNSVDSDGIIPDSQPHREPNDSVPDHTHNVSSSSSSSSSSAPLFQEASSATLGNRLTKILSVNQFTGNEEVRRDLTLTPSTLARLPTALPIWSQDPSTHPTPPTLSTTSAPTSLRQQSSSSNSPSLASTSTSSTAVRKKTKLLSGNMEVCS
jgi:hypothetical protein